MALPIVLPSLGMYTAEGTVAAWVEPHGATVEQGQAVLEIETEKATSEVPAPAAGVLHHVASVGALVKEEGLLGYILAPGESAPAAAAEVAAAVAASTKSTLPAERTEPSGWIRASPRARQMAHAHGVDLSVVPGSGPGGRIVEADVETAIARKSAGQG